MTTVTPPDTTASVADTPADLTDGYHLVVEALKLNDVRDHLRSGRYPDHRRRPRCAGVGTSDMSASGTRVTPGMRRRLPGS